MTAFSRELALVHAPTCDGGLHLHIEADLQPKLHSIARLRSFAAGQTILDSGAEPRFVGTIVTGLSRLIRHDAEGRIQLVGFMVASDVFGHPYSRHGPFSIEAATATTVCQFERSAFSALVRQSPSLQQHLISRTLDELDGAREWLSLLGCRTALERVASFLLILARSRPTPVSGRDHRVPLDLTVPITRADLAHYLGMTPETVSRCIHRLADQHTIRIIKSNCFQILDMPGLTDASGNAEIPSGPGFAWVSKTFAA